LFLEESLESMTEHIEQDIREVKTSCSAEPGKYITSMDIKDTTY